MNAHNIRLWVCECFTILHSLLWRKIFKTLRPRSGHRTALWALIRLLWSITKIPIIACKRLWMFMSNISADTWVLSDLIGVQNAEDSYCSLMKTIDKPVSLLSAHMNVFIAHMNTLIAWKQFAKVEVYKGSQDRKWRDEKQMPMALILHI